MPAAGQGSHRSKRLKAYEIGAFIARSKCGQPITVMALSKEVNARGECWTVFEFSANRDKNMEQGSHSTTECLIWFTGERNSEHFRAQPGSAHAHAPLSLSTANCPSNSSRIARIIRVNLPELNLPYYSSLLWLFDLILTEKMPRLGGTPRRGSNNGSRGGSSSRGGSIAHSIAPISMVPPPSVPSDNSGPSIAPDAPSSPSSISSGTSLNNSFHSARFQFKSRLNKPLISALVTVIFEEEEEQNASDNSSSEPSNVHTTSSSPGSAMGAVLNVPEQKGKEILAQKETKNPTPTAQKPASNSEPERFRNILHLVLPPGRSATDVEDNVMVEWVNLTPDEEFGLPPKE